MSTVEQPLAAEFGVPEAPHVAAAHRYMTAVLRGDIPANKWVRLACERQLRDLDRSVNEAERDSFPYRFDIAAAERICRFVELMPHIKGRKFVGTRIRLEPWQCWLVTTVFGWVSRDTGLRRFRRAYAEVAKGNAKSTLSSGLGNFMAFADNEPGAEVYAAACTRDQAKVVWSVAHAMLRALPRFCERAGIECAAHSINQLDSNSFFRPISSDANSVEGIIPYFIIVDELHAHGTRDLFDNLSTANGKRAGSMLWVITTAGADQSGICYEVRSYVARVLSGTAADESEFGVIYTIDDDDDWAGGPDVWRKANPNWSVSVDVAEIGMKIQRAKQLASAQNTVKTKHLNVWVGAGKAFFNLVKFRKCSNPALALEEFLGQQCVIGLDLAAKIDLLAEAKLFWRDEGEGEKKKRHYFYFGRYFLPEAQVELAQNASYAGWAEEGHVTTCAGETNDYDAVEDAIRDDARQFQVIEVAHDPWNAIEVINHLSGEGLTCVEVSQVTKNLSEPLKELEAAVADGRFHYGTDPVLEWAAGNVIAKVDRNGNLFPVKPNALAKIDPVSALLNALNRVMAQQGSGGGVSIFGRCARCGAVCEGKLEGTSITYDCGAHK